MEDKMSKHETWRTREYWERVGGLLIEEFLVVKGSNEQGKRRLDGVIVLGKEKAVQTGGTYDLEGEDVILIQTKRGRLGMYLLGQAYFSKFLVEIFKPKSIKSVAICGKGDVIMEQLAKEHDVEVVVISEK